MPVIGCKIVVFVFKIITIIQICLAEQNLKHKVRVNNKIKNEHVSDEIVSKSLASCLIYCSTQVGCISVSFKSSTEKCLLSSYNTICDSDSGHGVLTGIEYADGWTTTTRIKYPDSSICPDGWSYFDNSCYLFGSTHVTFYEAQCYCTEYDADLVNIENFAENEFIRGILMTRTEPKYWIGMTDYDVEGDWRFFPSLDLITWFDWSPNQINNGIVSNCGSIWESYDYHWVDEPCTKLFIPICERK